MPRQRVGRSCILSPYRQLRALYRTLMVHMASVNAAVQEAMIETIDQAAEYTTSKSVVPKPSSPSAPAAARRHHRPHHVPRFHHQPMVPMMKTIASPPLKIARPRTTNLALPDYANGTKITQSAILVDPSSDMPPTCSHRHRDQRIKTARHRRITYPTIVIIQAEKMHLHTSISLRHFQTPRPPTSLGRNSMQMKLISLHRG